MKKLTEEQQKVWDRLKDPNWHHKFDFTGVSWEMAGDKAPSNPAAGSIYFNTNDSKCYIYDGKSWIEIVGP